MDKHWDIEKLTGEVIRIALNEYKDKEYIDIRTYYMADDGELKPTKKGVTIPKEQYPELKEAILGLEELL